MMFFLLALTIGGDGCRVVVSNRSFAPAYGSAYVGFAPTYGFSPYYSSSALAYRVEDPERAALVRQNEKLTDALIVEVRASRERADRLESALGVEGSDAPTSVGAPPKAAAEMIVSRRCLSCHSGDKPKGGVFLAGQWSTAKRLLVADVVRKGEMPPKEKPQLRADEKKTIDAWSVVTRDELKQAASAAAK